MFVRKMMFTALACLMISSLALAQEARVAVCNPAKVFEALDERKAIQDKMNVEIQKAKSDLTKMKGEVEDMQRQLGEFRPGSQAYKDKQMEILTKAAQMKVYDELKIQEFARIEKENVIALYDKIREACKEVAAVKKLDLILAEHRPEIPKSPQFEQMNPNQVRELINLQDVLFVSEKTDVTQDVILVINKKYAGGNSNKGGK